MLNGNAEGLGSWHPCQVCAKTPRHIFIAKLVPLDRFPLQHMDASSLDPFLQRQISTTKAVHASV